MNTKDSRAGRSGWHLLTAVIWSAVTLLETLYLYIFNSRVTPPAIGTHRPEPLGHIALAIAGWMMVSSWRQYEQRQANPAAPSRHSLIARLWTQTLRGPLALWVLVSCASAGGSLMLLRAADHGSVRTVYQLRALGFAASSDALNKGLREQIQQQDIRGVTAYVDAGAYAGGRDSEYPFTSHLDAAVVLPSTAITELLLRDGAPINAPNHSALTCAVRARRIEQVRTLLRYYARVNAKDAGGETALSVARNNNDATILKLLQTAGAK